MNVLDFLEEYKDGLPDNYFDDDFAAMTATELMIMKGESVLDLGTSVLEVTPMVVLDGSDGLCVGRKYPAEPLYNITNDLEPSAIVLDWWKKRDEFPGRKFPTIPEMSPLIPPSCYNKRVGEDLIEELLIAHDFFFLNPNSYGVGARHGDRVHTVPQPGKNYVVYKRKDRKAVTKLGGKWISIEENIYHPDFIKRVSSITAKVKREKIVGYTYDVEWKSGGYSGFFKFNEKRIHSDTWIPSLFPDPTRDHYRLNYKDLVVSDYEVFSSMISRVRCNPIDYEPFFVDAYVLRAPQAGETLIPAGFSSLERRARTEEFSEGQLIYLPWRTEPIPFRSHKSGLRFSKIKKKKIFLNDRVINVLKIPAHLRDLTKRSVYDRRAKYELRLYRDLYKSIFVLTKPRSIHDDTVVRDSLGLSYRDYVASFVPDPLGPYSLTMIDVPFVKAPKNIFGTSLVNIESISLIEFVANREYFLNAMKKPYWSYRRDMMDEREYTHTDRDLEWIPDDAE